MMKWVRSDSYVLEKKLNLFCLHPGNLGETEFTGRGTHMAGVVVRMKLTPVALQV